MQFVVHAQRPVSRGGVGEEGLKLKGAKFARKVFETKVCGLPPDPPKRPIGFITPEDKLAPKASKAVRGKKAP